MARDPNRANNVNRPDFIPAGEEHLYPHIGGIFHDFIPDGETALTIHGPTEDAADEPKVRPRSKKRA